MTGQQRNHYQESMKISFHIDLLLIKELIVE